jgi:hypothetical protein
LYPAKYCQFQQLVSIFVIFHQAVSQLGVELGIEIAANAIQNNINIESI